MIFDHYLGEVFHPIMRVVIVMLTQYDVLVLVRHSGRT